MLAVALASLATAPTMPLLDAYALKGLALRGRAYSPVRLWGSVAFVIANFGAGFVIDRIAPIQIIWLLFGSLVIVAAVSLTLRPIAPDAGSADDVDAAAGKLLLSPGFWVFTGGASLTQASHAVYYGFSVLDWRAKGLDAASIGGLWGLAVIAEIALFALSARFPQRIGSLGLLGVGALGAVLRWGVMSLNPPLVLLPMLQLLHAFSFGATHLGSMQVLARHAPARQFATASFSRFSGKPFGQLRPPAPSGGIAHRNGDGLLLPNQHNQLLASGDAGVEKVSLQHGVMLSEHRNDCCGIFRSLAFVNGRCIGWCQHVEFAKTIGYRSAVKAYNDLTSVGINILDVADVAVVDLLVVVVLDLHHLVARSEGPSGRRLDPSVDA